MIHIKKNTKITAPKRTESTLNYKSPYKKKLKSITMTNETHINNYSQRHAQLAIHPQLKEVEVFLHSYDKMTLFTFALSIIFWISELLNPASTTRVLLMVTVVVIEEA